MQEKRKGSKFTETCAIAKLLFQIKSEEERRHRCPDSSSFFLRSTATSNLYLGLPLRMLIFYRHSEYTCSTDTPNVQKEIICSNSGHKACHDKIEKSYDGSDNYRRYEVFGGMCSTGEIEKMRKIVQEDRINVVCGIGDALGTYFEARACSRADAPSLENCSITRSAMALAKLCYETRNFF